MNWCTLVCGKSVLIFFFIIVTIDVFNFVAVALNGVTLIGVSLWIPLLICHICLTMFLLCCCGWWTYMVNFTYTMCFSCSSSSMQLRNSWSCARTFHESFYWMFICHTPKIVWDRSRQSARVIWNLVRFSFPLFILFYFLSLWNTHNVIGTLASNIKTFQAEKHV